MMEPEKPEQQNGDEVTGGVRSTKTVKLRVTDIEWLQDEACDDESPAAVLTRLHEEIVSLRATCDNYASAVSMLREENDVLRDGIDKLGSRTAIVAPGQMSIGDFGGEAVKDAMDAIKDVCDDEVACVKTALYLIDKKTEVVGKQLDRDHTSDEKEKDRDHVRDEKEKDRKLKKDLETHRADHQKNLALIKKGVVRNEDLEGVTFLGSMEKRKTPGEQLAERKKRAYHAADTDESGGDFDGEFVDDGESVYSEGDDD